MAGWTMQRKAWSLGLVGLALLAENTKGLGQPRLRRGLGRRGLLVPRGLDGRDAGSSVGGFRSATAMRMSVEDRIEISPKVDRDEAKVPWTVPGVRLPQLSHEEEAALAKGETVMRQAREKGWGEGFVVMDVDLPPEEAWRYLSDYQGYEDFIHTVREACIKPDRSSASRTQVCTPATFKLSRFRLRVNVLFRRDDSRWNVGFELDPHCKNLVLRRASGHWQLQPFVPVSHRSARPSPATGVPPPGTGAAKTRVWLWANVEASSLLPNMVVDYASKRAFRRATGWIRPVMEGKGMEEEMFDDDQDLALEY